MKWLRHWLDLGSRAIEDVLARDQCTGRFCFGGRTTIADINAKMLCDSEPAPYSMGRSWMAREPRRPRGRLTARGPGVPLTTLGVHLREAPPLTLPLHDLFVHIPKGLGTAPACPHPASEHNVRALGGCLLPALALRTWRPFPMRFGSWIASGLFPFRLPHPRNHYIATTVNCCELVYLTFLCGRKDRGSRALKAS